MQIAPKFSSSLAASLLLAVLSTAAGCTFAKQSEGPQFDAAVVQALEPGRSTRADVLRVLGPPDEIFWSREEKEGPRYERAFRYEHEVSRDTLLFLIVFGTWRDDTKRDEIVVFFDEKGVVEHVGSRFDAASARYGFPD